MSLINSYCNVTVPSDSKYAEVELRSDEVEIHSEVKVSSFEKQGWCKITRNLDLCSAMLQNKRYFNQLTHTWNKVKLSTI